MFHDEVINTAGVAVGLPGIPNELIVNDSRQPVHKRDVTMSPIIIVNIRAAILQTITDVLNYKRTIDQQREAVLDRLVADAQQQAMG